MKIENMAIPESVGSDYLIATYYMNSQSVSDLYEWASLVASDQSAGTWTHVEGETPEVIAKYGAKIVGIYPMANEHACMARIAFPVANFPMNMPMLMSTVAGNVLAQDGIKLMDVEIPEEHLKKFTGPLFGIDGIRKWLGVYDRPILGAILKPCIGVEPSVSAAGAVAAAAGGAEVIKDDELLSDPDYSPMIERVKAVMNGLGEIGKADSVLYSVNITGANLYDRARRAIDAGANSIMVNFHTLGWGAVEELVGKLKESGDTVPIFGHSAGAGGLYRSHTNGLSAALCFGKLARMIGMDMPLVYPDSGRFGITTNQLIETYYATTAPMGHIKKGLLVVAGGVHPGTVPYLMNLLGDDTMLMAGGGIYGHPHGAESGATAILQAINSVKKGLGLAEAAEEYKELKVALDYWKK
ncbi:MAG: hypothetical protein PWQ29_1206 [Verrucomicrobiota bacterium]|jgi:2,3-diketo-5-methylthiopentyl-1-phosphate enolase|nr:hypothetical protein [Verrucomicrobiota bacterium]MDK2963812.1 hypothetical protein [Verrucomicrobiota bacterium]